ncbi:hypothetical protein IGI04_016391 [Brassica rapa subsp. trilocularis]|uniref:Uncharacterized protein n=1 Tax=Brassica rapa subsp. trilocularis TaxID=1813537 RepID=A0ABQ7MSV4_BRACM|nr:hypothetical protein IGI04_016391 [Brassica rapa subsp. trilocularis]
MANSFSDLQTGHSSSSVEDGLLRFWESRIFHRGRELMGVDMLLLNSQRRKLKGGLPGRSGSSTAKILGKDMESRQKGLLSGEGTPETVSGRQDRVYSVLKRGRR